MFGLSFFEILFLLVMALIVIGPKQLPQVARKVARFINEFRRTANVMTEEMKMSMFDEEQEELRKKYPPAPPPETGLTHQTPSAEVITPKKASEDV